MPRNKGTLVWVLMGVCGCGKSTVGSALADHLGCKYIEADAYHSAANVAKMRSGHPLTDEDRWPWLDALAAEIRRALESGDRLVLGCSALKLAYRHRLAGGEEIYTQANSPISFVHLEVSQEVLKARMDARKDHFMPSSLIQSQFATLETDPCLRPIDAERPSNVILDDLRKIAEAKQQFPEGWLVALAAGALLAIVEIWRRDRTCQCQCK